LLISGKGKFKSHDVSVGESKGSYKGGWDAQRWSNMSHDLMAHFLFSVALLKAQKIYIISLQTTLKDNIIENYPHLAFASERG
jgi:hypothetical protein